jgi:hypothetical protein
MVGVFTAPPYQSRNAVHICRCLVQLVGVCVATVNGHASCRPGHTVFAGCQTPCRRRCPCILSRQTGGRESLRIDTRSVAIFVLTTGKRSTPEGTITLSLAWIRSVGNTQELVFASDSRLRAGQAWDVAPKIFTLPRSDALISFAGATDYAYPLVVQMSQALGFFPASRDRRNYISVAKGIALTVFNEASRPSCRPAPHRGGEAP